jgi:hypothetical protein
MIPFFLSRIQRWVPLEKGKIVEGCPGVCTRGYGREEYDAVCTRETKKPHVSG